MSDEAKPAPTPPRRYTLHCPHCHGHAVSLIQVVGVGVEIQCAAPICQQVLQSADTVAGRAMGVGVIR